MQHNSGPGGRLNYSTSSFLRRSSYAAGIRIAGLFFIFILHVLLARLIGDDNQYGKYAWGQSLLFMAGTLACMGVPAVSNRFIAALAARRDEQAIVAVIRRARQLLYRSSALLILTGLILAIFWRDATDAKFYREAAILALLLSPGVIFANLYSDMCRARQWLGLALLPLQLLRPIGTGVLAVSYWWLCERSLSGNTALGMAGASVLLVLLPQILSYHHRQRRLPPAVGEASHSTEYSPSRLFATALPIFITRCAGLTMNYANVLLLGFVAGPAAAGAYFAAERLANMTTVPRTVVSQVNQQAMAATYATGDRADLQRLATQSAHGSLWPTAVIGLMLILLATPLLQLFGESFASAKTALILLVASHGIGVLFGPAQDLLIMTGQQKRIPVVMLVSAAVHVVTLWLLVPHLGATGAAWSSIASRLLAGVWLMSLVRRNLGIGTTVLGAAGKPR